MSYPHATGTHAQMNIRRHLAEISYARAQLAAIVGQSIVYGMNVVLFVIAMYLLLTRRGSYRVTMILVSFTVAMFALATAYLALSLSSTFNAFLRGETASIQWGTEKGDRSVLPVALEVLNCILGDMIVIWRAGILWEWRYKLIALPMIFWIMSLVSAVIYCYKSAIIESNPIPQSMKDIVPWGMVYIASTFLANACAVVLVGYRYWLYQREVVAVLGRRSATQNRIFLVIIESGCLYCITWAVETIVFWSGSQAVDIVLQLITQLTSIYPTLITVLVCLKLTQQDYIDTFNITLYRSRPTTVVFAQSTRRSSLYEGDTHVSGQTADIHLTDIQPEEPRKSIGVTSRRAGDV